MGRIRFLKNISIKNKMIAIILLVAVSINSLGFIFIASKDLNRLKKETQSELKLNVKLIGDYCIVPLTFQAKQQAVEALSRLKFMEGVKIGYLLDKDNNLFVTYPDSLPGKISVKNLPLTGSGYRNGFFYVNEPIVFEGEKIGNLYVVADSFKLRQQSRNLVLLLSGVFLVMVAISYFLAANLQKVFTKPILKLARKTAEISKNQDFSVKLKPHGNDEIGILYNQFNHLMEQLSKRNKERDEAEKEISFLAQVVRNINESVTITDLDDRIIFVNQSFTKTYGFTENELIGKNIEAIRSPNNPKEIIDEILPATLKGGWKGELFNRRKDGSEFPILLLTTVIYNNENKPIALVGISTDITDRKKTEKELELHRHNLEQLVAKRTAELEIEKERALSADHLKSAFLATMSHELRTPLNSIIGFTGILLQERPGKLNDEQKKQLGMVQQSSRHLLSLINDVLDISKIEAGQLKLNFEQFNIIDVINKAVEQNKQFADKKNIGLIVSVEKNICEINSDKLRVQQMLLNLLSNAIKFTETGSVEIKCYRSGKNIKLEVIDTGIGIEQDKLDRLFKPFIQIDTGLSRRHEGTGLGLSICKKLTEMLGGTIEVESNFGVGSKFTITLPL